MRKSYFLTVIGLLLYLSTFPNHAGNYGDQPERTIILAENITAFKSSQGAISMSFGTESTFNPASTQDCAVAALDAAHFIVVYTDLGNSSKGTVRLATVNGNSISWGTEIIFNTGQTFDISVTTLDDSHFVIAYQDWSNSYKGTAIVGSVSGSSISFGSEYIFNAAWTSEISVTKLNSSSFVVAYLDGGNSNRGTAIYGYVSGNSISYGAEYIYNTTTTAENSIIAFDATHFAIAFRDTDNAAGASVYGTLSGSSISYSSKSAFNTGTTYYVSATKLNSDQFIVAYQDASNSSKATAIVGSISGGAITFGSEFIFNGTSTSYDISAITIDESRFLVTDRDNWWKGTARVGTVSSTDISWGTNYEYTSSNPNYNAAVMLDPTHFAAVYAISSGYGTGVVGLLVEEVITWDGSTNKDWNTASNWSGDEVPTSTDDVIIPNVSNSPEISSTGTADCKNLTISAGAILDILSDESGTGSLITNGIISNSGTVNIQRYISDNNWHLISSPNNESTALVFNGDYLVTWDESTAQWTNITSADAPLHPMQGYSHKGTSGSAKTYTFTGTPNTGDFAGLAVVSYSSASPDYNGANLLGNPYPSSIDWADLDDTYGSVFVWDAASSDYLEWNNGSGSGSQYIAPMQGFFIVLANASVSTFDIFNSSRTHVATDQFYKSQEILENSLVLKASYGSFQDELYLIFDESNSSEFEFQHDAYKLLSGTSGVSQLYSFNEDTKFSIDVRPQEATIQLGFQNNQDGVYSIGIKELNGLSGAFIEDTKTNTFFNLQNGNYQFEWHTSDNEKRFKFHLSATAMNEIDQKLAHVFAFRKTIYIQSLNDFKQASIRIVDMSGKDVLQKQIYQENNTIEFDLASGIYTVILSTEKENQVQKIMLNQ